jgi:hypothetical protein
MDDPFGQAAQTRIVPEPTELVPEFVQQMVQRLPLAQAVLGMFRYVLADDFLDGLFQEYRGQCYQDLLSFPTLVRLIGDALLVFHGSARQAIDDALKHGRLPCQKRAPYDKLRRLPLPLSCVLLSQGSQRLHALLPASVPNPLPPCFHGLDVGILDGKKIKNVAKRLLCTRGQPGKLLGGKLLAWYDPVAGMIRGVAAHRDGEANDNPLVPDALALARPLTDKVRLWVCDAQFCDLVQTTLYRAEHDHFLLRHHPKVGFHADPERPAQSVYDAGQQRQLEQQWGWLGGATDARRVYVRRVLWHRPGQKPLAVVTDLTDAVLYPVEAVLQLYLHRWNIETVFQEVSEMFDLKKLIGCTPEAVTFQTVLCMLVYNAMQLVRAYVAEVGPPKPLPPDEVSLKMLFTKLRRELQALTLMIGPQELDELIRPPLTAAEMMEWLRQLLRGRWERLWRKARNKTKRKYGPKPTGNGHHTSVHRLQQKHAELQKNPAPTKPP